MIAQTEQLQDKNEIIMFRYSCYALFFVVFFLVFCMWII